MVLPMIPRKYKNYLVYKFVLGFYTNTMKLYIKKRIHRYYRLDHNNTESGIKIKICQLLTNLWYEPCTWHGPKIKLYP